MPLKGLKRQASSTSISHHFRTHLTSGQGRSVSGAVRSRCLSSAASSTLRGHNNSHTTIYVSPLKSKNVRRQSGFYRNDPRNYRDARPLVTVDQLRRVARSPNTLYFVAAGAVGALIFYFSNLETVPVSGRTRFNCYSEAQVNEVSDMQANRVIYEVEHSGGRFLPDYDPRTLLVKRVMRRLIPVSGMADENWEIRVIDDPRTANAFVLPGGKVFVFSGILPITRNESGLAAVLGHEISHNLCEHFAERMSQDLIQGIFTNSAAFLAAGVGAFVIVQMLGGRLMNLAFGNPMSRKQESEADFVGLMMMAEACYDPREALGFWQRMEKAHELEPPEWLSTHPSNRTRIEKIQEWLPQAMDKRMQSDCRGTSSFADMFKTALKRGTTMVE